jgi:hypothetical protein
VRPGPHSRAPLGVGALQLEPLPVPPLPAPPLIGLPAEPLVVPDPEVVVEPEVVAPLLPPAPAPPIMVTGASRPSDATRQLVTTARRAIDPTDCSRRQVEPMGEVMGVSFQW